MRETLRARWIAGTDAAAELDLLGLFNGHEAEQDVGHSEVPESPYQSGYDDHGADRDASVVEQAGVALEALGCRELVPSGGDGVPSGLPDDDERDENDDDDHQDGLEEVGPAERLVPSEEGVQDDDDSSDEDSDLESAVVQEHVQDDTAALESGSHVNREEEQDDHGADDPEIALVVRETVGEELGHREGVLRYD